MSERSSFLPGFLGGFRWPSHSNSHPAAPVPAPEPSSSAAAAAASRAEERLGGDGDAPEAGADAAVEKPGPGVNRADDNDDEENEGEEKDDDEEKKEGAPAAAPANPAALTPGARTDAAARSPPPPPAAAATAAGPDLCLPVPTLPDLPDGAAGRRADPGGSVFPRAADVVFFNDQYVVACNKRFPGNSAYWNLVSWHGAALAKGGGFGGGGRQPAEQFAAAAADIIRQVHSTGARFLCRRGDPARPAACTHHPLPRGDAVRRVEAALRSFSRRAVALTPATSSQAVPPPVVPPLASAAPSAPAIRVTPLKRMRRPSPEPPPARAVARPRRPWALPTADELAAAIPADASSVAHVFDRRVNLDAAVFPGHRRDPPSLYALLRAWVQDDPHRVVLRGDLRDYVTVPLRTAAPHPVSAAAPMPSPATAAQLLPPPPPSTSAESPPSTDLWSLLQDQTELQDRAAAGWLQSSRTVPNPPELAELRANQAREWRCLRRTKVDRYRHRDALVVRRLRERTGLDLGPLPNRKRNDKNDRDRTAAAAVALRPAAAGATAAASVSLATAGP